MVARQRAGGGQGVHQSQACRRAVRHAYRHGAVQFDHRRPRQGGEFAVQPGDRRPVGVLGARGARVPGGDRRLQLIRPGIAVAQGGVENLAALADLRAVPPGPVLLVQGH